MVVQRCPGRRSDATICHGDLVDFGEKEKGVRGMPGSTGRQTVGITASNNNLTDAADAKAESACEGAWIVGKYDNSLGA